MKDKLINLAKWCTNHWLAIVILLTVIWSLVLIVVASSWIIGYYANALKGYHFELASCWQGVSIVAGAFASIIGLAKAGWTRTSQKLEEYKIDSTENSQKGAMPYDEEIVK